MSAVRRAGPGDVPALLRLLLQVDLVHHRARPDLFRGPAVKYSAQELEVLLRDETRPVFVFEDDSGTVTGHAFCILRRFENDNVLTDVKTLYIDDICVDETARRHGVGRALFDFVRAYAEEQGCYNLTLNVWTCNPGATEFYRSCGLVPQKVTMEQIL